MPNTRSNTSCETTLTNALNKSSPVWEMPTPKSKSPGPDNVGMHNCVCSLSLCKSTVTAGANFHCKGKRHIEVVCILGLHLWVSDGDRLHGMPEDSACSNGRKLSGHKVFQSSVGHQPVNGTDWVIELFTQKLSGCPCS